MDRHPWTVIYVRNFKEMRKHSKNQPVLIKEILPDAMAVIKKRMILYRKRQNVGAKRNELNHSNLRLQKPRRKVTLSKLQI